MASAYAWPLNLFGRCQSVSGSAIPSLGGFNLDETADQLETVFIAEEDATITRLFSLVVGVTGSPTAQISLQGVTSTGRADGSILASGNALATWSATANTAAWRTLNSSVSVTRGSRYCIVVQNNTGSTTVGSVPFLNNGGHNMNWPASTTYNNTGAVVSRSANQPVFGYGSSTKVWGNPISACATTNITSSGTTRFGNRIVIPSGWTSTYQIVGVICNPRLTSGAELDLELYLGTGAADTAIDASYTTHIAGYTLNTSYTSQLLYFSQSTLSTLNSTDGFRVAIKSNNGNQVILPYYDVQANDDWEAFGAGLDCYSRHASQATGRT